MKIKERKSSTKLISKDKKTVEKKHDIEQFIGTGT